MKFTTLPVTPLLQNCSLLQCEETGKGALVDPGGDIEKIFELIKAHGVELEKIFITHGHIDHVGGAAEISERTGCPIEGPQRADQYWIDGIPAQKDMYGLPNARAFTPDRWLEEGDTLSFGNVTLEVLHCPGHTPGHLVFFEPKTRIAFVGDVLFQGSIGRTDFPGGDYDTLINAIRGKLWPLGDDVTFVPGHGPLSTFGEERRNNPFVGDKVA